MRAAGILALGTIGFYASLSAITEGAAFRDIFIDQIITVQRGRYIPLSSATLGFLGLPILLATVVLPPIAIILGIILRRPYVTATNLATLVLLPHMLQRFDASHLFSTAALLVPWASITVCGLGRTAPWESQVRWTGAAYRVTRVSRIAVAGVGVWSALIALSYGVYLSPLSPLASPPPQDLPRLLVSGRQTVIADDLGEARDDRRVVSYLDHHATSRQSIMILPASLSSSYTRTDLYFVLGLRPSGRYLEVQPNLETQPSVQSAMVRALHATRWVLLVHGGRWYGPVASAPPTAADRFVRAHFTTVLNTPTYALMRHT
jgi:hypothetical protein